MKLVQKHWDSWIASQRGDERAVRELDDVAQTPPEVVQKRGRGKLELLRQEAIVCQFQSKRDKLIETQSCSHTPYLYHTCIVSS
jgi:hypothetical protein